GRCGRRRARRAGRLACSSHALAWGTTAVRASPATRSMWPSTTAVGSRPRASQLDPDTELVGDSSQWLADAVFLEGSLKNLLPSTSAFGTLEHMFDSLLEQIPPADLDDDELASLLRS